MKTALIYYSTHHGNTGKLAEAIAAADPEVQLFDATQGVTEDLSPYDLIGLASGIYGGNFAKPILRVAEEKLPAGKRVFLLYTSALELGSHTKSVRKALEARQCTLAGEFNCRGYNTFGPFKLVGGTAKGHPTEEDLAAAVAFYKKVSGQEA